VVVIACKSFSSILHPHLHPSVSSIGAVDDNVADNITDSQTMNTEQVINFLVSQPRDYASRFHHCLHTKVCS
jgi:hypothetical protein